MNMQALMAQAKKMQNDLMKKKEEINKKEFKGKSELVEVVFNGNKELLSVNIEKDSNFNAEDIDILEDMIQIAVNDALKQIDKEIDDKLGAATGPLSGLF